MDTILTTAPWSKPWQLEALGPLGPLTFDDESLPYFLLADMTSKELKGRLSETQPQRSSLQTQTTQLPDGVRSKALPNLELLEGPPFAEVSSFPMRPDSGSPWSLWRWIPFAIWSPTPLRKYLYSASPAPSSCACAFCWASSACHSAEALSSHRKDTKNCMSQIQVRYTPVSQKDNILTTLARTHLVLCAPVTPGTPHGGGGPRNLETSQGLRNRLNRKLNCAGCSAKVSQANLKQKTCTYHEAVDLAVHGPLPREPPPARPHRHPRSEQRQGEGGSDHPAPEGVLSRGFACNLQSILHVFEALLCPLDATYLFSRSVPDVGDCLLCLQRFPGQKAQTSKWHHGMLSRGTLRSTSSRLELASSCAALQKMEGTLQWPDKTVTLRPINPSLMSPRRAFVFRSPKPKL